MEGGWAKIKQKASEVFHSVEKGTVISAAALSMMLGISEQAFAQEPQRGLDPTYGFDVIHAFKTIQKTYEQVTPGSVVVAPGDTITYTIKQSKDDATKLAYVFTESKQHNNGKVTRVGVHEVAPVGTLPQGKFDKIKIESGEIKNYLDPKTSSDVVYGTDEQGKPNTISVSRLGLYHYYSMMTKYAELTTKPAEKVVVPQDATANLAGVQVNPGN